MREVHGGRDIERDPPSRRTVVLAGNIAAGKTTTVKRVGGIRPACGCITELVERHLHRFYADPRSHAFANQLRYTIQFLERAVAVAKAPYRLTVEDRSIYEAHDIFSRYWFQRGMIDVEQFELLERIVNTVDHFTRPTHVVLLTAPAEVLLDRVRRRGNPAEAAIGIDYLRDLEDRYRAWFESFSLCPKTMISSGGVPETEVVEAVSRIVDREWLRLPPG